jgi:hypothetical protein
VTSATVGIRVQNAAGNPARCKSCQADIVWFRTAANDRPIPVDAEGIRREEALPLIDVVTIHAVPHFATCPNAAQHRKARR